MGTIRLFSCSDLAEVIRALGHGSIEEKKSGDAS